MAPTLYLIYASPPVRAVLITAKAIDLELNLKEVDVLNGEHLTQDYLKKNPQHTVPTLQDDDGFIIWDSHAITTYLVSKYANNDALYPKDIQKRALIDQRLHFESGVLFARLLRITKPIVFNNRKTIYEDDKNNLIEAYGFLEKFLENNSFMAGDTVTLADYSLFASVGSIRSLVSIDPVKFPKLLAWLERVGRLPECNVNKKGLEDFEILFKTKLNIV